MAIPDIREFQEVRAGLLDDEYPPQQVSINTVGASVWSNGRNRPIVLTNEGEIVARNSGLTAPVGTARITAVTSVEADDITDRISVGVARYDSRRNLYSNHVWVGIAQELADPESGSYVDWLYDPEWNDAVAPDTPPYLDFLNSPESRGGFTLGNLHTLLGDHETDEYDHLAILIYTWTGGELFVVEKIPISGINTYGYEGDGYEGITETTINVFRAAGANPEGAFYDLYVPNQSFVFPAVRALRTMTVGGQQRLIGAHMAGFDPFKDMPPLFKTTASARLNSDGVLTLNAAQSHADLFDRFRDGTHIIIGFDETGEEILRGFIGPASGDYYQIISDVDGATELEYNQVQICRTFDRDTVYTQDGDENEGAQTWIIRRQVVALVTNGSREVKLYHDLAMEEPAEHAHQYFVHGNATVQGIGSGFIDKVHTVDGTWYGSLDDGKTVGDGLILRSKWAWETGIGFFSVEGRSRVVFVGRGQRNTFDTTGLGYEIPMLSRTSIMAIENYLGNMLILTQLGQVYVVSPNPFEDPATFELAVEFDVREVTPDQALIYNGTCISTRSWVFHNGAVGWIGSEGPWVLDGSRFTDLADQEVMSVWSQIPKASLANGCCTVDQSHKSGGVIRFGGMRLGPTGKNDFQMALHLERGTWLDYTGTAVMDSSAVVQTEHGGQRILFGGNARLWWYGDDSSPLYGFPHVAKTRFGTVRRLRDNNGSPIVETDEGEFVAWGSRRYWDLAGIKVAVIDDTGATQYGTILTINPDGTLAVQPETGTWQMAEGRTYRFIIGPRRWSLELPWRLASGGFSGVEIQAAQFDATDRSRFDWPMRLRIEGSLDSPNLDDADTDAAKTKFEQDFLRSRFLSQNRTIRFAIGSDHRLRMTMEGVHPPDSHLSIRRILLDLRYHGPI